MTIKKKPFQRYRLEEEKKDDKRLILSVSLNEWEQKEFEAIKPQFKAIESDSTIFKRCAFLGMIVIQKLELGVLMDTSFIKKKHKKHKNLEELEPKNQKSNTDF